MSANEERVSMTNEQRTFYVGYEDGEEMYIEHYDHIFCLLYTSDAADE